MSAPEMIALCCPNCREAIYRPLPWFRQAYGTCPHCGGGVAAGQFAELLAAVEAEFDAQIEELLSGRSCSGGCCGSHEPPSPREIGSD